MKTRLFIAIVALLVVSLSLTFAQTKEACTAKASTTSKSCCKDGVKASTTSGSGDAKVMTVSDQKAAAKSSKECTMAGAKASSENCSEADKAHCDMMKASMIKADGKMDCGKGMGKTAKAVKKTRSEKSEAKGTN